MTPVRGAVYYVRDGALRLPPDAERQLHLERRPFLVLSSRDANDREDWPLVVGCPTSTSTTYKTRWDVTLPAGAANLTKKTWVRVPAVQPLERGDLGDRLGILPSALLTEVEARLATYLGLLEE